MIWPGSGVWEKGIICRKTREASTWPVHANTGCVDQSGKALLRLGTYQSFAWSTAGHMALGDI